MPIAGGVYTRTDGVRTGTDINVVAANAGVKCTATLADERENDIASAINTCLFRDGTNAFTNDMDIGGNQIVNLADGAASTDAANVGQVGALFSVFGASLVLAATPAAARAILPPFDATTAMLFVQTAAPTGWTKVVTHNDKALRVVSGTASSGGTKSFSTSFTSRTPTGGADGHALTTAELATHTHTATVTDPGHHHTYTELVNYNPGNAFAGHSDTRYGTESSNTSTATTGITVANANAGSGSAHSHTLTMDAMDFAVQYVDVIIATMDAP